MISGFTIVKDALKIGYPFVESIASALPICDEFLISEGYSTDGTFEVVQRISDLNKKIKIYRQVWPISRNVRVIGEVTDSIRAACKYDYLFYVQPSEIVHEDSQEFIRALPEMYPDVHTFVLPYWQLLERYKWTEEFRLRFCRNLPEIVTIDDATMLGPSKTFTKSEAFKSLKRPKKLLRYVGRGIEWTYANSLSFFSRAAYLPKPIFRYWSIFPRNFLAKCLQHAEILNRPEFYQIYDSLKNQVEDPALFWSTASKIFRSSKGLGINYPKAFGTVSKADHPAVIQDFISNPNVDGYYVREEVLNLISKS